MIYFLCYYHTKKQVAKEIFETIYQDLQNDEILNYPFHYDILEKKKKLFDDYIEKKKSYSFKY